MTWWQVAYVIISAVGGGFVGGWVVAFRLGSWRQKIEDRLETHDRRLDKGNSAVDRVPVLITRVDVIIATISELKEAFRDFAARCVTQGECDRRHERV